jgi:hypothetical protein
MKTHKQSEPREEIYKPGRSDSLGPWLLFLGITAVAIKGSLVSEVASRDSLEDLNANMMITKGAATSETNENVGNRCDFDS